MELKAVAAMVRKDLKIFLHDRRAVVMTFVTPIAIAAFFGFLFSGAGGSSNAAKIPVRIVDLDNSSISKAVAKGLASDSSLEVSASSEAEAREAVRKGKATVAVVVPKGFGDDSAKAFFGTAAKPELGLLYDPSHGAELGMVRGILTQHVMEAVSQEAFNGPAGKGAIDDALKRLEKDSTLKGADRDSLKRMLEGVQGWQSRLQTDEASDEKTAPQGGITMPFATREEAVTASKGVAYNSYAHSFAGMGVQFILFAAIELGVGVLLERQRGLWKRLRSAPLSRGTLLGGKLASGALISLLTFAVTMGFGMVFFGIRIQGSVVGFLAICLAFSLMASAFGLLLAALGKTPQATRGIAIFAVLILVMLGGAWVPAFIFPAWLQRATLAVPTRWAVDGLDAMTWRGVGLQGAIAPVLIMAAFALLFVFVAVWRFRWEED
jgi:ABC-2 type transport system permease protein